MKRQHEPRPLVSLRSFNVLADGFTAPFAYYAAAHLPWGTTATRGSTWPAPAPGRRDAVLAALTAPAPAVDGVCGPPSILAVQELQCTTRGWGRFRPTAPGALAADGGDHALWLRLALAARGYGGAALAVKDDAPLDVRPHHDLNQRNEWPCGDGRPAVALFWREDVLRHVATREVSFPSHMRRATGGEGEAWRLLRNWCVGLLVLLRHAATGALLLVGTTHLPTPGSGGGGGGGSGEDAAGVGAPRGVVQQVQFGEALVAEAAEMLGALGLRHAVPLLLCGDFNAQPGSALHRLLLEGSLPAEEPCLRLVAPQRACRWSKGGEGRGEGGGGGAGAPPPPPAAPLVLPYPAPNCAGGGAFESAYAAARGGVEPPFTNFRRLRREVPAEGRGVEEGEVGGGGEEPPKKFEELPVFEGTLDYIMLRNPPPPPAAGGRGGGPPRTELRLRAVGPLPSREELLASPEGAAPNAAHPSDHFPLCAVYELLVGEEAGAGE
jgi:hypothetical protein